MSRNSQGFTLIEVMVAMVILMVGMLALLNTAAVVIENNITNILRDEALTVAEEQLSALQNTSFDSVASSGPATVTRTFRGVQKTYTVNVTVTTPAGSPDTKKVQINVTWPYKNKTLQHSITTVVNRG